MKNTTSTHAIKDATRGGQVFLHNLRMVGQVLGKVVLWTLPVALLMGVLWFIKTTDTRARYVGEQWAIAQSHVFFQETHAQQRYTLPAGHTITLTPTQLTQALFVQQTVAQLTQKAKRSAWAGGVCWVLLVLMTLAVLKRSGRTYLTHTPLKGDAMGDVTAVNQLLNQQGRASDLVLGKEGLTLPQGAELQHFLVHGTTGSGKSTLIKALLDHIRHRGERAIVYDKSCQLVSQFYRPDTDHVLNPLDARSVPWDLWAECRDKPDFENVAAALIPMVPQAQDPFWVNAARTIFAAAAYRMRDEKGPKLSSFLKHLLTAEIGELQRLLSDTEAESLVSEKTEKTAISIKSVLATYLKSLSYLRESETSFSIRQWLQQDVTPSWLFISSLGDKHESLKPLMTAWLDIAVNALLSLSENPERRLWVILDEVGSLQQLPYLTAALAEARKFGGCFVIGTQSYAQLAKIYGFEGGREISSLLNTRFLFRVPDPDVAQWSAKNLGETTLDEVREGISYGANSQRDGVSIQRAEREKPVVPASEILRLEDLACYVRLAGTYPIVKLHLPYTARPKLHAGFIPRPEEADTARDTRTQNQPIETQAAGISNKNQEQVSDQSITLALPSRDPHSPEQLNVLLGLGD